VFFVIYVNSVGSKISGSDLICAPYAPDIFPLVKGAGFSASTNLVIKLKCLQ
jgi:hypothetical protein